MEQRSYRKENGAIIYLLVAYEKDDEGMAGLVLKPEELGARSILIEEGKDTGIELLVEVGKYLVYPKRSNNLCGFGHDQSVIISISISASQSPVSLFRIVSF